MKAPRIRGLAAGRRSAASAVLALLIGVLTAAPLVRAAEAESRGFVDSTQFVELAGGEDRIRVEIRVTKSLIDVIMRGASAELRQVLSGIESLHAVVLDLDEGPAGDRARKAIDATRKALERKGWNRIALVREDETVINVLVLEDGERIQGLLVLMVDSGEGELVFANVAGVLDLAALQELGAELNIPGLGDGLEGIDR